MTELGTPIFSADGKHVAYPAVKGDKVAVGVDDQVGAEYDGVVTGSVVFSARTASIWDMWRRKGRSGWRWWMGRRGRRMTGWEFNIEQGWRTDGLCRDAGGEAAGGGGWESQYGI